jgi:DNA invertase Pin-like site-specific DNA recombinase
MFVRGYLRASTSEQDASRAKDQLQAFAADRGLQVAAWYTENESGAKLARPELFRLLADSQPGDILLVEQVDRLSRLTAADWERLKAELTGRRVRVVALDLPTSWIMTTNSGDEFTGRMFEAINGMLLDMLAAVARKDYDDRRPGRHKARRRPRPKVDTRGVQKTSAATKVSPACWPRASRGVQSRTSRAAAARPSRRSPNATAQPLERKRRAARRRCGLTFPSLPRANASATAPGRLATGMPRHCACCAR